jgi:bisanhydrobacterioruberin hydratase
MIGGISIRSVNPQGLIQQKVMLATGIALLVHAVGLIGMVWIDRSWFSSLTPVNLLLMSVLLIWTQEGKGQLFYRFMFIAFTTGMVTEIVGVNTGLLFGSYAYGDILGFGIAGVPLVIGMNWFVVMIAAASSTQWIIARLTTGNIAPPGLSNKRMFPVLFVCMASLLAVFFDWIMEPAAIRLGFWNWSGNGDVPFLNYFCWFIVSFLLLTVMRNLRIRTDNVFAAHLLFIQAVFFVLIRVLL